MTRRDFPVLWPVMTRWADNDMFGHVNNAVYYELFDTAINGWILHATGLDAMSLPARGVVAESGCTYLSAVSFPERLTVGLRIKRLGRSSVTYDLALFRDDIPGSEGHDQDGTIAALGRWVHVYIDPGTRTSVAIPEPIRSLLETYAPGSEG